MASRLIEYSQTGTMTFACDSNADLDMLPTTQDKKQYGMVAPIGSTAIIGNDGGDLEVHMLFSFGWKKL